MHRPCSDTTSAVFFLNVQWNATSTSLQDSDNPLETLPVAPVQSIIKIISVGDWSSLPLSRQHLHLHHGAGFSPGGSTFMLHWTPAMCFVEALNLNFWLISRCRCLKGLKLKLNYNLFIFCHYFQNKIFPHFISKMSYCMQKFEQTQSIKNNIIQESICFGMYI